LRHGCAVLGRHAGPGGKKPSECAVEVRPSRSRPSLDHDEAVGRENERRDLGAKLLGRAERSAVQPRLLRVAGPQGDLDLQLRARARTRQLDPRGLRAEPDELGVVATTRRKALRADVQRLEQVRLAGAVPADSEDEPRRQLQLE
jgi:hypothetical protein